MSGKLTIRDQKTKDTFFVDASEDRAIVKTSDGEKVRLHPIAIKTMVKQGQTFDGHTRVGTRTMERLK